MHVLHQAIDDRILRGDDVLRGAVASERRRPSSARRFPECTERLRGRAARGSSASRRQ